MPFSCVCLARVAPFLDSDRVHAPETEACAAAATGRTDREEATWKPPAAVACGWTAAGLPSWSSLGAVMDGLFGPRVKERNCGFRLVGGAGVSLHRQEKAECPLGLEFRGVDGGFGLGQSITRILIHGYAYRRRTSGDTWVGAS